jgi:hypothetical protein
VRGARGLHRARSRRGVRASGPRRLSRRPAERNNGRPFRQLSRAPRAIDRSRAMPRHAFVLALCALLAVATAPSFASASACEEWCARVPLRRARPSPSRARLEPAREEQSDE